MLGVVLLLQTGLLVGACADKADDANDQAGRASGAGSSTGAEGPAATSDSWRPDPAGVDSTAEQATCPAWPALPAEITVQCWRVAVPMDYAHPDGPQVRLLVARGHREGVALGATPVLYLHGGPGGGALADAPGIVAKADMQADRDMISVSQRGASGSDPQLDCPEYTDAILDVLSAAAPWAAEYERATTAIKECRARLSADGIDLNFFNTPHNTADIDVVRRALGIDTWHVFGGSYGTRLALDYARTYPNDVASVAIDSVYPPDLGDEMPSVPRATNAVDRLLQACADDPACNQAYPDLRGDLDKAVADLTARPERVSFTPPGGEPRDMTLTGTDVYGGIFSALYETSIIPLLPSIIHGLANGDRSIVPQFLNIGVPQLTDINEATYGAVDCADNLPALSEEDLDRLRADPGNAALVAVGVAETFCREWDVRPVDKAFLKPAVPTQPTLIVAGAQAKRTPGAVEVELPRGGHTVITDSPCLTGILVAFWRDGNAVDTSCAASVAPTPFAVT